MSKLGDMLAFPGERFDSIPSPHVEGATIEHVPVSYPGMTYRMWLAGRALQGLLSNPRETELSSIKLLTETALETADWLITQLESEESK